MAPKSPPKGRTSIKGIHQKQCEFLRDGVINGKKAAIIKTYLDLGMDATVKKHFPSLSAAQQKNKKRQIYKWIQKENQFFERAHLQRIRAVGLTLVLSDDDEDFIAHWIRDLRREGVPVSHFMLENKAKEVAEYLGPG
ncbi:hypothetical protein PHPALM_30736 [Phytophthora palmivora]|uniref:HTH CENPB-type domain-containing protein n=1 Tax=Phytophthora palmivora TaxID=4796 RepID=A0A2P4X4D9_9STRA|nr:hypothetical protein PHPALM_30736 [Phytophthora palmivora]